MPSGEEAPWSACAGKEHAWLKADRVLAMPAVVPDHMVDASRFAIGEDVEIRSDQNVEVCGRCGLVGVLTQGIRREIMDLSRLMQDALDANDAKKGDSWRQQSPYGLADDLKRKAFNLQAAIAAGDKEAARRLAADVANYAWMAVARLSIAPEASSP